MSLKSAPVVHAEAYTPDMKDDGFWLEEKPFKIIVIREIIHIANFNGARLYEAKIGKEDIEKKNMPHDIDLAAKLMTDILLNHVKNSRFNLTYGECGVKIDFELQMEYNKFDFEFYLQEKGGEMDRMGRQIELLKDQSLKLHKELQRLEGEKLLDIADNMSYWFTLQFIRHTIPDKFGDIMKPDENGRTAKYSRDIIGHYTSQLKGVIMVSGLRDGQPANDNFNQPFVCGKIFSAAFPQSSTWVKIKAIKLFVANHYHAHCVSIPLHYNVLDECEVAPNFQNVPWISLREHIKKNLKIE